MLEETRLFFFTRSIFSLISQAFIEHGPMAGSSSKIETNSNLCKHFFILCHRVAQTSFRLGPLYVLYIYFLIELVPPVDA